MLNILGKTLFKVCTNGFKSRVTKGHTEVRFDKQKRVQNEIGRQRRGHCQDHFRKASQSKQKHRYKEQDHFLENESCFFNASTCRYIQPGGL